MWWFCIIMLYVLHFDLCWSLEVLFLLVWSMYIKKRLPSFWLVCCLCWRCLDFLFRNFRKRSAVGVKERQIVQMSGYRRNGAERASYGQRSGADGGKFAPYSSDVLVKRSHAVLTLRVRVLTERWQMSSHFCTARFQWTTARRGSVSWA
jgi:hypothetical protein